MSELAKKLIEENKRTKAKTLDLGNCGLSEIPAEVGELVWLESLDISEKWYDAGIGQWRRSANAGRRNKPMTSFRVLWKLERLQHLVIKTGADVSHLAGLTNLRSLNLIGPQVSDVRPLGSLASLQLLGLRGTSVSRIAPLGKLTNLQSLDLGMTRVGDVSPLSSLSALNVLDLSETPLSDPSPLAALAALQTLHLSRTQVSDVSVLAKLPSLKHLYLARTQVSNLAALASLSALQTLNLFNTPVSDASPLGSLYALEKLYLGTTKVIDISALASLSALQTLGLTDTQVSDIGALASLSALQRLYLGGSKVSEIAALSSLADLQVVSLARSNVSDLAALVHLVRRGCPIKWSSDFRKGAGIYVENCPLTNPPPEIIQQGYDCVLNYFAEREKSGADKLYEAKMLIVGDGGAGKTSLLRRLYEPDKPLPIENDSTKGISIYRHTFVLRNGRTFRLNVWDFGGQEIYHATHQFFLTHRSLYVLLDDTRKDDKSVQDPGFRYWLGLVELFGGGSPVLIFQNEKSGRSKAIDIDGIKGRYTNVREKYEGDLANEHAADKLRDAIEHFACNLSHIGEELPAPWVKVRAEIEERAASESYISQREYFNIYSRHLEFDETKALFLSRYLHDLGVFLHFQNDILLKDTVILQNEWATQAVFRVLDDEAVKKKLGRFGEEDCARIWKDSAYASKHAELLALMKKFELCYELPDKEPREWLAPQLLPPAKPAEVKDWKKHDDLVLRYEYAFLPKGMISRLTVRMHRFVKRPEMAWTTGVLFERESTAALVELLADGQQIEIRARGPEGMGLLSAVSFDLDALNDLFPGLQGKVAKLVPCPCKSCTEGTVPHFFDHRALVRRLERGKLQVECGQSYEEMDVVRLLNLLPGPKGEPGERDDHHSDLFGVVVGAARGAGCV